MYVTYVCPTYIHLRYMYGAYVLYMYSNLYVFYI